MIALRHSFFQLFKLSLHISRRYVTLARVYKLLFHDYRVHLDVTHDTRSLR